MLDRLKNFFFERDVNGDYWYTMRESNAFGSKEEDNLQLAQTHPLLTPGLLFISNLFAQGQFKTVKKDSREEVKNHWILNLLANPNYYQTQVDFLESLQFMKIARGYAVVYARSGVESGKPDSLYILDPELIKYPEDFITPFSFRSRDEKVLNQTVFYNQEGENIKIKLKNLIYLFDLPSGFSKTKMVKTGKGSKTFNKMTSSSRIDGIKQTCWNTQDSLIAKNIILRTNGKEMLSAKNGGFPLQGNEQREAEAWVNQGYGLSWKRRRTLLTKASLEWKSMHIALRDLGLDESIKVDGNIIFTALMIPKDIMSIEAKKTTYNNFKESMTSFIQNEMQSMMNDFVTSLMKYFVSPDENIEIVGTYDHLPVMGFVEEEKYSAVKVRAEALTALRNAGIPDDLALDLLGLDNSITLKPPVMPMIGNGQGSEDNSEDKKYKAYLERLGIDYDD